MKTRFAKSAYGYFILWGICASLATTVCTIVDALLVGNLVGSDGLAVANLSTPVFLVYALFGVTVGVGANVKIGRLLGGADVREANRVFQALLTLGLLIGGLCLVPLAFRKAFFTFLGVGEALYPLAEQYLTVVLWSAPLFVLYHILSVSVRTDSDPKTAAAASAVVIATNLSLDLLFMKVLKLGIVGASASLCIAEGLGTAVLLTHFARKEALLKLKLALPTPEELRGFLANGFGVGSAFVFQAVVMLVFNTLLLRSGGELGTLCVAAYGVIYTVSTVPFAVFEGASNALSTVTAFFVGESDVDSIFTVLKNAVILVLSCALVMMVLCILFAEELVCFFGIAQGPALAMAAGALQLFCVSILFTGINTVATAFWQSIGRAKLATAMSVARNFLLMLAAGGLLIPRWSLVGLSAAYILVEGLCALATGIVLLLGTSRNYVQEHYGAPGKVYENNYPIQAESMEQISRDLERLCEEWEISMKQAFFISFICEELLLNIIKFGLDDPKKQYYISIRLMEKEGGYVLRIRDNVRLYNPFESSGDDIDNGVLKLIQKKARYCDYQRKLIFNYLYLIL